MTVVSGAENAVYWLCCLTGPLAGAGNVDQSGGMPLESAPPICSRQVQRTGPVSWTELEQDNISNLTNEMIIWIQIDNTILMLFLMYINIISI